MTDAREQFGREAIKYLHSASHSNEAALARCLECAKPRGGPVLDVATGAGHVAYTFAPHSESVVALDVTQEMLDIVDRVAGERGLSNITTKLAPAENLPFEAETFEGVTCRVAPHHFHDVRAFLSEVHRVLRPNGWFLLVDTIGIDDPLADQALQEIETLRDPSHIRNYTAAQWHSMVEEVGMTIRVSEQSSFPHNAFDWLNRMSVGEPTFSRVVNAIVYSEGWLRDYFRPTGEGETLTFRLHQILLVADKI